MKYVLLSFLLSLNLTACGGTGSPASKQEDNIAGAEGSGTATISFSGHINETKVYDPITKKSSVYCWQSDRMEQSEISIYRVEEGGNLRDPSQWVEQLSFTSRTGKFPTGRISVDENTSNPTITFRLKNKGKSELTFYRKKMCNLDILKNGNNLTMSFSCSRMMDDDLKYEIAIQGQLECSLLKL